MEFSYFCLLLAYHLLHNFKNLYTLIKIIHKGDFSMSTATSTQTSSTECPSTESSTTAADPVLTREEAIAILAGPDSELPELLKRAGALRSGTRGL